MSVAKIHFVKHARQTYQKVAKTDEQGRQVVTPLTRKDGSPKTTRKGRQIVRRIRVADKSQPKPALVCEKDGTVINPGDPYRWFTVGFRSSYRRIRCMNSTCTPKESERESSGPRSEILAAIEDANDQLDRLDVEGTSTSDVEEIVQGVGEAFGSAAEQWREADDAFGGGGLTENGERADTAEGGQQELESWTSSSDDEPDYEACDDPDELHTEISERTDPDNDAEKVDLGDMECDGCSKIRDDWFEELLGEARDAIDSVEVP